MTQRAESCGQSWRVLSGGSGMSWVASWGLSRREVAERPAESTSAFPGTREAVGATPKPLCFQGSLRTLGAEPALANEQVQGTGPQVGSRWGRGCPLPPDFLRVPTASFTLNSFSLSPVSYYLLCIHPFCISSFKTEFSLYL